MTYNITFGLIFLGGAICLLAQGMTLGWTTGGVLWLLIAIAGFVEKLFRVAEIRRERLRPPGASGADNSTGVPKAESNPHD